MEIEQDLVSVIMPVYKSYDTIIGSVESVLNQSYTKIDLIIVIDGADELIIDILQTFNDKRIRVFSLPVNKGVAAARNFGLNKALGRYIAFLDSDDQWLPHKLETQLGYFNDSIGLVSSDYYYCDEQLLVKSIVKSERFITLGTMCYRNKIGNLTGIYDRSKTGVVFQNENIGHEDYQMWIDLLALTDGLNVQEPLAMYRSGNSNSLSGNKIKSAWWGFTIRYKNFGILCAAGSLVVVAVNHFKKRYNL